MQLQECAVCLPSFLTSFCPISIPHFSPLLHCNKECYINLTLQWAALYVTVTPDRYIHSQLSQRPTVMTRK